MQPTLSGAPPATPPVVNRIPAPDVNRDEGLATNLRTLQAEESPDQPGYDSYISSAFNDCLYSAMYAVTAAADATSKPAINVAANDIGGSFNLFAQSNNSTNLVNLTENDIGAGLGLLSTSTTTELVGTSVYLGDDPRTGAPALQVPTQSLAISCTSEVAAGGDAGLIVVWQPAGMTYGPNGIPTFSDGGVAGSDDGGAPGLSCPQ